MNIGDPVIVNAQSQGTQFLGFVRSEEMPLVFMVNPCICSYNKGGHE